MKLFLRPARLPFFGAALTLAMAPIARAQSDDRPVELARVVHALQRDLRAIPSGSQPTDPQKQTLSADLGRIFRTVNAPPTLTLDFVANKLAAAVAQSQFSETDLDTLARQVTDVVTSSTLRSNAKATVLEAELVGAGVGEAEAQQLAAGARALGYSTLSYTTGDTRSASLKPTDPTAPNYRHTFLSNVELDTIVGPQTAPGGVTDPYHRSQGVSVALSQVPLGRYQVSVTTVSTGQTLELGPIRVGPGVLIYDPDFTPINPRAGRASFGDFYAGRPLPDGLSVDDLATLAVTNKDGAVVMTAQFARADPAKLTLTHSARGPLTATPGAPSAGGSVGAVTVGHGLSQNSSLLLSAVNLPATAALTLSINGAVAAPVTTGPTGNLFVKTGQAVFPKPPRNTEVINVLPDAVDLRTATSFAVSDTQGNVLLSATTRQ